MAINPLADVLRRLRGQTALADAGSSDEELLERFVVSGNQEAFAMLVRRHGPAVLRVCRQTLKDPHDADDAFQATFLILVRKAESIGRRERLAGWLYGVAQRVSARRRAQLCRRREREHSVPQVEIVAAAPEPGACELWSLLHEEVMRLPSKYRLPVILCYLEGKTHEAAAQELSWPKGTVSGRLARARNLLHQRLKRRGLVIPSGGVAVFLWAGSAGATLPPALLQATLSAAKAFACGAALAPSLSSLTDGVLKTMFLTNLKTIAALGASGVAVLALLAGLTLAQSGGNPAAAGPLARSERPVPEQDPSPKPPVPRPHPKGEQSAPQARAESGVPAKYRPMVEKALKWLADQQNPRTGQWEADDHNYPIAMTALSGMALLGEGSTVRAGKYSKNIKLARDYLTSKAQANGLIGDLKAPGEANRYRYGHGYALLFLATVYSQEKDAGERRKLEPILVRAAKFSREAQTSRGGWGPVAARKGGDFDDGSAAVAQVQALRAARDAGIKVPPEAIKDAQKYLGDATGPDGGVALTITRVTDGGRPALTAAAIACGFSPSSYDQALVKKWFQFCTRTLALPSRTRLGNDEYTLYYYAQALYLLGDEGHAKLFPDVKEADRVNWKKYRENTFDFMMKTQSREGFWTSSVFGSTFATSLYLTVLQLDNAVLPIYKR